MQSRLALITFLDGGGGNYPDNTLPGIPAYPDNSLPGGGGGVPTPPIYYPPHPWRPGHGGGAVDPGYGQGHPSPPHPWLPGHGGGNRPDNALPGLPVTPDNTLPPSESTTPPTISLPIVLPPTINPTPPGHTPKFELKWSPVYGWILVPVGSDLGPDNELPATPEPK